MSKLDKYLTLNRELNDASLEWFDAFRALHTKGLIGKPSSGACFHVVYRTIEDYDAWSENTEGTVCCPHLGENHKCTYTKQCPYKEKNKACYDALMRRNALLKQVGDFYADNARVKK